jgi:Flp pilus assembly protein TadG
VSKPSRASWRTRLAAVARDDSGMTTLEVAVLFPITLILIFGIAQTALWYMARSAALAAAQEGVTAGRAYNAKPGDGPAAARNFLNAQVGDILGGAQVGIPSSPAGTLRITVSGTSLSLIPGWKINVSQSAQGPLEKWNSK